MRNVDEDRVGDDIENPYVSQKSFTLSHFHTIYFLINEDKVPSLLITFYPSISLIRKKHPFQ